MAAKNPKSAAKAKRRAKRKRSVGRYGRGTWSPRLRKNAAKRARSYKQKVFAKMKRDKLGRLLPLYPYPSRRRT